MTKPMNLDSIEKATQRSWEEWVEDLKKIGADNLTHTEIAAQVNKMLEGKIDSPGWWAQGITVAFEQHIGKRQPGQLANGLYEITVSRAIELPRRELFAKIVEWFEGRPSFRNIDYVKSRSSETPKRSNWRCDFVDGSKFIATVEDSVQKSRLILTHTSLPAKTEADAWKLFWQESLNEITTSIK